MQDGADHGTGTKDAPHSRLRTALLGALALGAGFGGGAAIWKSRSVAAAPPDTVLAKQIEAAWKAMSTTLGFEFAFLDLTTEGVRTLADTSPGQEVLLPWLSEGFPQEAFVATATACSRSPRVRTTSGGVSASRPRSWDARRESRVCTAPWGSPGAWSCAPESPPARS